jgi:hypothetical protein
MLGEDLTRKVLEAVNSRIILEGWDEIMVVLTPCGDPAYHCML